MEDDNYARITLRIPKTLHSALTESAHATSKSMNAEIVARLQQTFFESASPVGSPVVVQNFDDLMDEFMRRYNIIRLSEDQPQGQEIPSQAADMPMDPPKRRVNTRRGK